MELGPGSSGRSLSVGPSRPEDPINALANDTDRWAAVAAEERQCLASVSRLQRVSQIKERERAKLLRHASTKAIFHQPHQSAESFKAGQWKKERNELVYTSQQGESGKADTSFCHFQQPCHHWACFPKCVNKPRSTTVSKSTAPSHSSLRITEHRS